MLLDEKILNWKIDIVIFKYAYCVENQISWMLFIERDASYEAVEGGGWTGAYIPFTIKDSICRSWGGGDIYLLSNTWNP